MNTVFQQILDLGTGKEAEQGDKEIDGNTRAIDLTDDEKACPDPAAIQVQQARAQVPVDINILKTILDTVSRENKSVSACGNLLSSQKPNKSRMPVVDSCIVAEIKIQVSFLKQQQPLSANDHIVSGE